jgi:hypothetical protein
MPIFDWENKCPGSNIYAAHSKRPFARKLGIGNRTHPKGGFSQRFIKPKLGTSPLSNSKTVPHNNTLVAIRSYRMADILLVHSRAKIGIMSKWHGL